MTYQVDVLKVGQSVVPGPEVYWMDKWDTFEQLYFYVVLIRGGNRNILINTGPPYDLTRLNQKWGQFIGPKGKMIRRRDEEIDKALEAYDLTPQDIDYVLITPLQAYATANIPLFDKATICISQRGWIEDYHKPAFPLHVEPELRIPPDVLTYLTEYPDRTRLLADEEQVLSGIHAKWVGTHHRSSMAYSINTAQGNVVISDCFFKYDNLEKMHPLGILESMAECFKAYEWVAKTADIAIPLYDPEVFNRYENGKVA